MSRFSKEKGKRGEREFRDVLIAHGFSARRGQQFAGSPDSPDVIADIPFHIEVKRCEKLNLYDAMAQAINDNDAFCAGSKIPIVAHKRNGRDWLIIIKAEDFLELIKRTNKEG